MNENEKKIQIAKYLLYGLTGVVLLVALYNLYIKDGSGFGSIILTLFFPFIPLQIIVFVWAGIKLAKKKNKTIFDYILFVITSLAIIINTYFFAISDREFSSIEATTDYYYIYEPFYIISILFSVIILVKEKFNTTH